VMHLKVLISVILSRHLMMVVSALVSVAQVITNHKFHTSLLLLMYLFL